MRSGLAAVLLVAATACGGGASMTGQGSVSGDVTVLAAASLTDAFHAVGQAFARRYSSADVRYSFGGSPTLAAQIEQGAPADVFASADEATMDRVAGQVAGARRVFARNRLQVAVAPGNPKHVRGLADLARSDLVVVLCAPAVPCGAYAEQAFRKAGVTVVPRSEETDVRAVLTKVATGEADAGVVYATDVRTAAGKVEGVDIPDTQNVPALYPVAELKGAENQRGGRAFVDFLLSDDGESILGRYGFERP